MCLEENRFMWGASGTVNGICEQWSRCRGWNESLYQSALLRDTKLSSSGVRHWKAPAIWGGQPLFLTPPQPERLGRERESLLNRQSRRWLWAAAGRYNPPGTAWSNVSLFPGTGGTAGSAMGWRCQRGAYCWASLPLCPTARPCCRLGSSAQGFSIQQSWKMKLSKPRSTRVEPAVWKHRDRHISTSSPDGLLWLGRNDFSVDERRNHLVQKHFVAPFSPLSPQSWEAARTATGTGV